LASNTDPKIIHPNFFATLSKMEIKTTPHSPTTTPTSPSIASWMYSRASNFLSHVVAVEPPPEQEQQPIIPKEPIEQKDRQPQKDPQSLVEFIYDLAGLSPSEQAHSPLPKNNVEELFDASKVVSDDEQDPEEAIAEDNNVYIPPVDNQVKHNEPIFSSRILEQLQPFLPVITRMASNTTLLYSMEQHGISIRTLYSNCQEYEGGSLVVIQTQTGSTFGAFVPEHLHIQGGYYGTGER
jgi:hypothetical protein